MSLGTILEAPEHEFDDEDWEDDEEFGTDEEELDLDEYERPDRGGRRRGRDLRRGSPRSRPPAEMGSPRHARSLEAAAGQKADAAG